MTSERFISNGTVTCDSADKPKYGCQGCAIKCDDSVKGDHFMIGDQRYVYSDANIPGYPYGILPYELEQIPVNIYVVP